MLQCFQYWQIQILTRDSCKINYYETELAVQYPTAFVIFIHSSFTHRSPLATFDHDCYKCLFVFLSTPTVAMLSSPLNIPKWFVRLLLLSGEELIYSRLEENSHLLKPPINNYCVYNQDVTVMVRCILDPFDKALRDSSVL